VYNPYNYQVAVRDDAMFFGREEMLTRLVGGLSAPTPLSAAIFGGRRSGKTSLLSKLRRTLDEDARAAGERCFIPCSLDLQRGRPLKGSDDFFLWVLEELGEAWEQRQRLEYGVIVEKLQTQYRNEMSRGPVDAFVHTFRSLDTGRERIRLAILIDESENILTVEWGDDLRPNLRYLLSNSPIVEDVALVMAGSTQMYTKVTERDSPLENILDRYCLPTLSREATLALAREPNDDYLPEEAAEEVWCHTGGHPCMAQYTLHELWDEFEGQLQDATAGDVRDAAESFEERTRHFSSWTDTLGQTGRALYRFLVEQDGLVNYGAIRQHFEQLTITELRSALDALLYHGLVHCHGRGRTQRYSVAGKMYPDWLLAAGKLEEPEQVESPQQDEGQVIVHGDYVAGDKPTGVDQRDQWVHGPQTNIASDVQGPVLSGQFGGPVAVGGGEAVDLRESQGAINRPTGPVDQQFGDRTIVHTTGDVVFGSQPDGALDLTPSPEATRLHRILSDCMDLEEFRTLCFDLGVSYDSLRGEGLTGRARQLVLFLQKREALPRLVEWLHRERPDIRNG
jgi:DNA-binding transcriptional ArsR family regulator